VLERELRGIVYAQDVHIRNRGAYSGLSVVLFPVHHQRRRLDAVDVEDGRSRPTRLVRLPGFAVDVRSSRRYVALKS